MTYSYIEEKENLFTPDGVKLLLKIRDTINQLLDDAGAFQLGNAIRNCTGSSFTMLACIDYLYEIGEIEKVGVEIVTQNQVYIRGSVRI